MTDTVSYDSTASVSYGYDAARVMLFDAYGVFHRQRDASDDSSTRLAGLAMAQIGLAGLSAVSSLFGGIKKRTAEKDANKLSVTVRNVTPLPIVFFSTHNAHKGEGVPVLLDPDNKIDWPLRQGRIAANAADGGLAFRCLIVKSSTLTMPVTVVFSDESDSQTSRAVRLHSVSFDHDQTFIHDPNRSEDAKIVHPAFFMAAHPFPVFVYAVPVTNGSDAKIEVVILSAVGCPV